MFQIMYYSYVLLLYIFLKKISLELRFILILILYKQYSVAIIKIIKNFNSLSKILTQIEVVIIANLVILLTLCSNTIT